jgi:hypothetical protein
LKNFTDFLQDPELYEKLVKELIVPAVEKGIKMTDTTGKIDVKKIGKK